jgi:hypothetical protein
MKTKNTSNYTATLLVDQSPKEAFKAITNLRGWWSEGIEGNTDKLHDEFFYHYKDIHLCRMKLIELVPNQKAVWLVVANYFKFTKDKSEWKGTKIIFDISQKGKRTEIKFTHEGLVPQYECYEICREAWTHYITESLRDLITTGKGQPNTKDVKGFDTDFVKKWKLDQEPDLTNNKDYTATILVDETQKKVFNAINNVAGWWTENLEGNTEKLKDTFTVRFGETFITMQVVELVAGKKIVWLVTDCYKHWLKGNKTEWTGTKISFEITEKDNKTQVRFTHLGLIPKLECFDGCSDAWGQYIKQSLKGLITTGKGRPEPKEKKATAAKN